jgi:hypothetical protein
MSGHDLATPPENGNHVVDSTNSTNSAKKDATWFGRFLAWLTSFFFGKNHTTGVADTPLGERKTEAAPPQQISQTAEAEQVSGPQSADAGAKTTQAATPESEIIAFINGNGGSFEKVVSSLTSIVETGKPATTTLLNGLSLTTPNQKERLASICNRLSDANLLKFCDAIDNNARTNPSQEQTE